MPGLLQGTAEGRYDAAVAALTITDHRKRMVDFRQPFYLSGLGTAVPLVAPSAWALITDSIELLSFAQAILDRQASCAQPADSYLKDSFNLTR